MKSLYKSPEVKIKYFLEIEVLSTSGLDGDLPFGDVDFESDNSPT